MKRSIGLMLVMAMLALAAAGCTAAPANSPASTPQVTPDAGTPAVQSATAEPTTEPASEESQWPKTIIDGAGNEIVLEKKPERVTLLHVVYMEYFLMLDAPPTAAALGNALGEMETLEVSEMFAPYFKDSDIEMTMLGNSKDLSMEALLASAPDVIVTFYNPAGLDMYEQMVKIAPVVQIGFTDPWQDQMTLIGSILGKEAQAQAIIEETEQIIEGAKETLSAYADRSLAVFRTDGKGFIAQRTAKYYDAFGLTRPEGFGDTADSIAAMTVSLEAVAEMNPDYIVFQHNLDATNAFIESLESSSVWQSLDAVKNGHVYFFDENMNSFGPMAMQLAAKKLVEIYAQ